LPSFTKTSEKLKYALKIDKAVLFVLKASPKTAFFSFFIVIVQGLLPVAGLYLIKLIIDCVSDGVSKGNFADFKQILILISLAALVELLSVLCQQLSSITLNYLSISVSDYVYKVLHEKSVSADLEYYENSKYFDTLHRAQQEGPYRPVKIVNGLSRLFQSTISLAGITVLLFSFHWSASFILMAAVIPGIIVKIKFAGIKFNWARSRTQNEREASYLNWLITGYYSVKEIRLFNTGKFFIDKFAGIRKKLKLEEINISKKRAFFEFISQFFSVAAVFGALFFIACNALKGLISVGSMVMYYQGFQKGLVFFKNFLGSLAELYEDNLFIANFYEFLDVKNKIKNPENPIPFPKKIISGIEFKNVSFKYPGTKKYVLKNLSFKIKPGQTAAIAGENGAGKSTLVKLLCRFYDPDEGRILIDGKSLTEFDIEDLRKNTSVLFQDFVQYHFDVKTNIWMGDTSLSINSYKIRSAAKKAGIDSVIEEFPDGYETILGKLFKNGEELSKGQWQKIALARAFLKQSSIVILDEPSSSLDPESEFEIFTGIKELLKERISLIISHRFSTIKSSDTVIVLSKGQLKGQGNHFELIENNFLYKSWYEKQSFVEKKH